MNTRKNSVGGRPARETMPFKLSDGEKLVLDILIDRAVIEVFANEKAAIFRRAYPTDPATHSACLCSPRTEM